MTEHPTQATEFSEFDLRLEAKAGNRIRIGGNYKTSSSMTVKPQTGKRRTLTREGTETLIEIDPDDYAKLIVGKLPGNEISGSVITGNYR